MSQVSEQVARRMRFFEPSAFFGVVYHELTLFRRYWHSSAISSILQPTIYLLAFGLGLGAFIPQVAGYRYLDFVATGMVGMGVMFSSAFPGMYTTFVRREFQKVYDGILAAPVDVHEMVTAESATSGLKAGIYGSALILVAIPLGLRPTPGALLVPLIGVLTAFGFALLGMWIASIVSAMDTFTYVNSLVLTPLFIVGGTFFPLTQLPPVMLAVAQVNPLYHCVQLVRHVTFGTYQLADLAHLGALVLFVALAWALAVHAMRRKLLD